MPFLLLFLSSSGFGEEANWGDSGNGVHCQAVTRWHNAVNHLSVQHGCHVPLADPLSFKIWCSCFTGSPLPPWLPLTFSLSLEERP